MRFRDILRVQLRADEGVKKKPYVDTVGKTSIGIGRNLTDVGLSDEEITFLLENDIKRAETAARTLLPNFDNLTEVRKAVVCNMAFNMGLKTLSGFTNTLKAINTGKYDQAADGMLSSRWRSQVGDRAVRLARQMREG